MNMDMIMENVKGVELNAKIARVSLNHADIKDDLIEYNLLKRDLLIHKNLLTNLTIISIRYF